MFFRITRASMFLSESAEMNLGSQRTMKEITTPVKVGLPQLDDVVLDFEKLLPLSVIRTHTKTDDVPYVTDDQLARYRRAAFEACEKYTSRVFSGMKVIREPIQQRRRRQFRASYVHRLRHPSADGIVYIYGSAHGSADRRLDIGPGGKELRLEVVHGVIDASSCCGGPCDGDQYNYGMMAMYRTGIGCANDLEEGIILGILKFIAWAVSNPGDEIMTVRNREAGESSGIVGTNNGAWASGAVEQWRIYVDDV